MNNRLTDVLSDITVPVAALIVYETRTGEYYNRTTDYRLENRPINDEGRMEAAKPVSYDFMRKLAETFSDRFSNTPHGPIPRNMLYADTRAGSERYVWFIPPGKRMLHFIEALNIPNGKYQTPGLVFMVEGDTLSVFAYATKRLTHKTQLYSAPFFNTASQSGEVCLGNAKKTVPSGLTYQSLMAHWERLFWGTEFSHIIGGCPTKTNLVLVQKKSREHFDTAELRPIRGLTVQKLMK